MIPQSFVKLVYGEQNATVYGWIVPALTNLKYSA